MSTTPELSAERLSAVASRLLEAVGLPALKGHLTAQAAWDVHCLLNVNEAFVARNKLFDVQDAQGHGTAADVIVELVMNGSAFPAEAYPVAAETWKDLGYELHKNGDDSHVVQIPAALRLTFRRAEA